MKTLKITSRYLQKAELTSLNKGEVIKNHHTFSGAVNHVKKNAVGGCGLVIYNDEKWNIFPEFDINEALQMIQ